MELKITPSGQTIVKPTALGPVANTDTKLLIYGLFQKGRVLAQDGEQFATANGYYQTALHELGHASGHPDRMDRDTLKVRSSKARRSSCNLSRNGTIVTAYVTTYTEKISMRKGCEKNHHYSTQSALLSLRKAVCFNSADTSSCAGVVIFLVYI